MKIHRAHKIQLCPNNKQAAYFRCACGTARFAYNWGLAEWKKQYSAGGKPSAYALKKQFNKVKRHKYPWVIGVTKCAPEAAFHQLGVAFTNFFHGLKNKQRVGYPKFKKKGRSVDAFTLDNTQFSLRGRYIHIPKLGWVRMRESLRYTDTKILSATVSNRADKWFISVAIEMDVDIPTPAKIKPVLGVDVGVRKLATLSNGVVFENPCAMKKTAARLRRLQKAVSRKKKGSRNRLKAVFRLRKLHYRVACIRNDAIHKATNWIVNHTSHLGIEDLHVRGMLKNHRLAGSISDASMAEFLRQLRYKAHAQGVIVTTANRFYVSSKTCSQCGSINSTLGFKDIYVCEDCGNTVDRDLNAAINLETLAAGSVVSVYRLGSAGLQKTVSGTADWVGINHRSCISNFEQELRNS